MYVSWKLCGRCGRLLFPTSLCGVLVFDSVSRVLHRLPASSRLPPPQPQLCFTSWSSTTFFIFPSFPVPATTSGAHYWKKLPCGVIRSFNSCFFFYMPPLISAPCLHFFLGYPRTWFEPPLETLKAVYIIIVAFHLCIFVRVGGSYSLSKLSCVFICV